MKFNPVTQMVVEETPPKNACSLQHHCRMAILKALTLKRIHQVSKLPLPARLKRILETVRLSDLLINPAELSDEHHQHQIYPATCLLDNSNVLVKVIFKGQNLRSTGPTLITRFEVGDTTVCLYLPLQSLDKAIQTCIRRKCKFEDIFILKMIKAILKVKKISTKLTPSCIDLLPDDRFHIDVEEDDTEGFTFNMVTSSSAVYLAPEVLARKNPDSRALSWTIGCIVYELLALKPPYYDNTGKNPFQVYKNIMQGIVPQGPPDGNPAILSLTWKCLKHNPDERICLEDIAKEVDDLLHQHGINDEDKLNNLNSMDSVD